MLLGDLQLMELALVMDSTRRRRCRRRCSRSHGSFVFVHSSTVHTVHQLIVCLDRALKR